MRSQQKSKSERTNIERESVSELWRVKLDERIRKREESFDFESDARRRRLEFIRRFYAAYPRFFDEE